MKNLKHQLPTCTPITRNGWSMRSGLQCLELRSDASWPIAALKRKKVKKVLEMYDPNAPNLRASKELLVRGFRGLHLKQSVF